MNSCVLVVGSERVISKLWATNPLLLLRMSVRGCSESQEYSCLLYMEMTRFIYTVAKTLGCICLGQSTDDEVYRDLRRVIVIFGQERVSVSKWIGMDILKSI